MDLALLRFENNHLTKSTAKVNAVNSVFDRNFSYEANRIRTTNYWVVRWVFLY